MTKKQSALIGILVLLCGVSLYLWVTRSDNVDPALAEAKFEYLCPHCNSDFVLTAGEYGQMFAKHQGIFCPKCGKSIDDPVAAAKDLGAFQPEPVAEAEKERTVTPSMSRQRNSG